jgi:hypothetical protein
LGHTFVQNLAIGIVILPPFPEPHRKWAVDPSSNPIWVERAGDFRRRVGAVVVAKKQKVRAVPFANELKRLNLTKPRRI